MREARMRAAAEWQPLDLLAVKRAGRDRPRLARRPHHASRDARSEAVTRLPHRLRRRGLPEDDPRLERLRMSHGRRIRRRSALDQVRRARCAPEAAIEPDRRRRQVPFAGRQDDADHRDLRQGRHRQELHARQPQLHDGAAGQEGAADRLRPEERHDVAAVRRPRLPDDHRDHLEEEARRRGGRRSATSASSATACTRWSSAGPRSAAAAADAGSSTASRLLEKLGFHDWGFDYVLLDFLGDVVCGGFGLPIARDMCQKVIVVGQQRPAVAVRRQQRVLARSSTSASSAATSASPAW